MTLTAAAGAHPVATTYYTLDGGAATKYTGPFAVSGEAVHPLTYWSVDASGFIESAHSATVAIDATPPVTSVYRQGETVTLSGNGCRFRGRGYLLHDKRRTTADIFLPAYYARRHGCRRILVCR